MKATTKVSSLGLIEKAVSKTTSHMRGNGLRAKSARGGMMLGLGTFLDQGLRFLLRMILARLLGPEHLGVMAIVMVASLALESFTEVGVKQSIIQNKKGASLEYLNAAWWLQVLRGICLYLAAFLSAPLICRFYFHDKAELLAVYGQAEIVALLRVAFLAVLFNGLTSPRAHVLEKEFRFGKSVFLTQGSGALSVLATIGLVFYVRNVWALVIGFVAEVAIRTLLSFIICPFRPRLSIDRTSFGEIGRFARGMFGLPILSFISTQTHFLVLGKMASMVVLGMYVMAVQLANIPNKLVTKIVGPVLLPAFSQKQENKRALCSAVVELSGSAMAVFGAFVGLMAIYATPILSVVYTREYAAVSIPFSILCVLSLLTIYARILGSLFLAIGLPHLHRGVTLLRATLAVVLMYPAVALFGAAGAAGAMVVAFAAGLFVEAVLARKVIGLSLAQYAKTWLPGLAVFAVLLVPRGCLVVVGVESIRANLAVGGMSFLAVLIACLFIRGTSARNLALKNTGAVETTLNETDLTA